MKVFTRKRTLVSVFTVVLLLLVLSASAFAAAKLVLRTPRDLLIGINFNVALYTGSGTGALGTHATPVASETNAEQAVWEINTVGAYNYTTSNIGTSTTYYNVRQMLYITSNDIANNTVIAQEIMTGLKGDGWDIASAATGVLNIPTKQLLEGKLGTPANSPVYRTPMFTKPWYPRFQFTTQPDLIEFVVLQSARSPYAHLFYLDEQIDPATGQPFGSTSMYSYKMPVVVVTTATIPAGSSYADAVKAIKDSGNPTLWHQAQIHGNEPSPSEGAMAMLSEMVGPYGAQYLHKVNYICVPRFNLEGARLNIRTGATPLIDLNRDHLRLRAKEVRMLHNGFLMAMPEVLISGHELGGYAFSTSPNSSTRAAGAVVSADGITVNVDIESTPATSMNSATMDVVEHSLSVYMPAMFSHLQEAGIFIDHYQNGSDGWMVNGGVGHPYFGLMGTISVLVETRGQNAGLNMSRRAHCQLSAAKSMLETLYFSADRTKDIVAKSRAAAIELGKKFDPNRLVYLNQTASGNSTNFRNTGIEELGSKYTTYKGARYTLDLLGGAIAPTGTNAQNVVKSLALNDTSNRNRPRPTAYVIPKGITNTSITGAVTVDAANGYAINYEFLVASMKRNHIEFYEIAPGATADVRQYFRTDAGNTTNGAITADLRPVANMTFTNGAYVVPLDQVASAVVLSLFEPDDTHQNGFNAGVTHSLSGAEGLALVLHDFTTRDYPYYRFEKNNPRDELKDPKGKECNHKECIGSAICKLKDVIKDLVSEGCNTAGFGGLVLILIGVVPFVRIARKR